MATFAIEGTDLVVRLSAWEKLGACRGNVRIPLATISDVRVSDEPWSELRGMRVAGTGWPGVISLCTRRGPSVHDFCALYGKRPAVLVDTAGARFKRVVVSSPDPQADVRHISEAVKATTGDRGAGAWQE